MHRTSLGVLIAGSGVALSVACSDGSTTPLRSGADARQPSSATSTMLHFLPYGVPIPEGQELTMGPEPYDPKKHGPGVPNTQPEANLANTPPFANIRLPNLAPPRATGAATIIGPEPGAQRASLQASYQLAGEYFQPSPTTQWYGISSAHQVWSSTQSLPQSGTYPSEVLISTTPAGNSCISADTRYEKASSGAATTRTHMWTNWCFSSGTGVPFNAETMDATFQSKYVRTQYGRPMLNVSIVTPNTGGSNYNGQCWYGHLYNFNLGQWELKASACQSGTLGRGVSGRSEVWTLNLTSCPTIPGLRVADIIITESSSGFSWASTSFSSQTTFGAASSSCFPNSWDLVYPATYNNALGNAWEARTPLP